MIIKTDRDIIKSYFEDHSGLLGGYADKVIFPETEKEIYEILEEASAKKVPVTISGGGTGVTGGRIPFGGWVLATDYLNKIIDIDSEDFTVYLQAGVRLNDLQEQLSTKNLTYPPEPTEPSAFVGGTISTNASGARGFRYGPTRNYVKKLKIMLSTGEILNIQRGVHFLKKGKTYRFPLKDKEIDIYVPDYKIPDIKTSAGYYIKDNMDLLDLFIGQEGTLGVILEIALALGKRPEGIMAFFGFFNSEEDALHFVKDAKFHNALSLEYMDSCSLDLLRQRYSIIPKSASSLVYFEQDYKKDEKDRLIDMWMKLLEKHHASSEESFFADSEKERERLRELRHALPEMVNEIVRKNGWPKAGTDIAVPENAFREMYDFYKERLAGSNINFVIFGHIGENHMHVNILPKTEEEFKKTNLIYMDFVKKAISLGGTISAEHGIGKLKHRFLEVMYGKDTLREMAMLKKSLDPVCIFGLGNIFPEELLR